MPVVDLCPKALAFPLFPLGKLVHYDSRKKSNMSVVDLCPRAIALQAAKLVERAYRAKREDLPSRVISSGEMYEYIRSVVLAPKIHLDQNDNFKASLIITTEAGVDAFLEIESGELRIGIAGTNSFQDWLVNLKHIKDSLFSHWQKQEFDRSYKLSYETLSGYIFNYLFFYQHLVNQKAAKPIGSITIAGHSAGARVADWLARELSNNYHRSVPIELYTFASPLFREFYSQKKLDEANISLFRYAIASDLISELPAELFKCDRTFTQVLPAIALWKRPHRLAHFIDFLSS